MCRKRLDEVVTTKSSEEPRRGRACTVTISHNTDMEVAALGPAVVPCSVCTRPSISSTACKVYYSNAHALDLFSSTLPNFIQ